VVANWNGKFVVKPVSRLGRLLVVRTGGWFTVSVKFCDTLVTVLLALIVMGYVPPTPAGTAPLLLSVPPALRLTKAGSPVAEYVGAGNPEAVTGNEPAAPVMNVVPLALVKAGGWFTVNVKFCVVLETTLVATIVSV
jgi:hypothetical protein